MPDTHQVRRQRTELENMLPPLKRESGKAGRPTACSISSCVDHRDPPHCEEMEIGPAPAVIEDWLRGHQTFVHRSVGNRSMHSIFRYSYHREKCPAGSPRRWMKGLSFLRQAYLDRTVLPSSLLPIFGILGNLRAIGLFLTAGGGRSLTAGQRNQSVLASQGFLGGSAGLGVWRIRLVPLLS